MLSFRTFINFLKFLSSQQAGFNHIHRARGAVGPNCVFDVVIPYQDSSQKERIVGQYCTPEQATGGAAVGDYDGDGMEDIYFTVFDDRSILYKNNGEFNLSTWYYYLNYFFRSKQTSIQI